MSLFAIGDLHFGFGLNKPMDIFGERWKNHEEKIKADWVGVVGPEDTVIIPGDISWGMRICDAAPHLDMLNLLPGRKALVCGNHDYWWCGAAKLRRLYPELIFIKNDSSSYRDYAICGTRGWVCPKDAYFSQSDIKIYNREQIRLRLSLDDAVRKGYKKIILALHYPPTNDKKEPSAFTEIIGMYPQIKKVLYGHLHGEASFNASIRGVMDGTEFQLVSADFLNFKLKKILP